MKSDECAERAALCRTRALAASTTDDAEQWNRMADEFEIIDRVSLNISERLLIARLGLSPK